MRGKPTRWLMTTVGKPFVPTEFDIEALAPFIERRPLSEFNHVFQKVHSGARKRRTVLIPAS